MLQQVVEKDDYFGKVRAPNRVGMSLVILSLTTIRGRRTAIIDKLI